MVDYSKKIQFFRTEVGEYLMAKFKVGDKAFIVENNNRIREVEVRSASGGMYLIKFPETGGGIKLKESRLFATKEEAQKSVYGYRPNPRMMKSP